MDGWRGLTLLVFLLLAAGTAWVYTVFRADLQRSRAAVAGYDTITINTSFGPVETADTGQGTPLLSIHGTGGGFDQGLVLAAPFRAGGFRIIAPSRFGYLGTPVPASATAADQADAFAELLDALGVDRAVVTGTSAGAITALHFAARHPDRTLALLLFVPAYYPDLPAPAPWSPLRAWAVTQALQSDVLFWVGVRFFPDATASAILATDPELIAAADPSELARIRAVLWMILPISDRSAGLLLDTRMTAAPVPVDLAAITAPTFVASAEDDRYRTAESARLIAAGIPDAELLITPDGGHAWLGRQEAVQAAARDFLVRVLNGQ